MFAHYTPAARAALSNAAKMAPRGGEITTDHLAAACIGDSRGRAFLMAHLDSETIITLHERALDVVRERSDKGSDVDLQPFSATVREIVENLSTVDDVGLDTLLIALTWADDGVLSGIDLANPNQPILTGAQIMAVIGDDETLTDLAERCGMSTTALRWVLAGRTELTQDESDAIRAELGISLAEPGVRLEHSDEVIMLTHDRSACEGRACTIHNRSDHHLRQLPQHWRDDAGFMERTCAHGIGHPDPDELPRNAHRVHGCDGCCAKDAS